MGDHSPITARCRDLALALGLGPIFEVGMSPGDYAKAVKVLRRELRAEQYLARIAAVRSWWRAVLVSLGYWRFDG